MHKKWIALMMAFLILICLIPVHAASEYRLVFNDTEITTMSKTIERGGILYISSDMLTNLKASYVYEGGSKTFTIFKGYKILSFDMEREICITDDNRFYSYRVFFENNTFYMPAQFVVQELGFNYAKPNDSIIRISNISASLTNQQIVDLLMPTVTTDPVTPETPATPDTPVTAKPYYLGVIGAGDTLDAQMKLFDSYSIHPSYFLTMEQMEKNPQAVRDLMAAGYPLGLTLPADQGFSSQDQLGDLLDEANDVLQKIGKTRTCLVLLPEGAKDILNQEDLDALTQRGYRVWLPGLMLPSATNKTASASFRTFQAFMKTATKNKVVILNESVQSLDALEKMLSSGESYAGRAITEYVPPVNTLSKN